MSERPHLIITVHDADTDTYLSKTLYELLSTPGVPDGEYAAEQIADAVEALSEYTDAVDREAIESWASHAVRPEAIASLSWPGGYVPIDPFPVFAVKTW